MEKIPKILLESLSNAESVVVLTGAGVSAESGIKTFRDPDGLWAKFNPMELASVNGFMSNPQRVWEWYQFRREVVNNAQPNPGHYAIAEMEKLFPQFTLITQNVDRLHQRAGSKNVLELHGNIIENHCFKCKEPYKKEIDLNSKELPICPLCGAYIRPSVVWFGEMLPEYELSKAYEVSDSCDVFFSVGTSAEVYPAANLPYQAKRNGAFVVEVNPNRTSFSHIADVCLTEPSGVILPILITEYKEYIKGKK